MKLLYTLIGLSLALTLMSPSCEKNKEKEQAITEAVEPAAKEMEMLKYDFDNDYKGLWRKVDSLQNIGLYDSALKLVHVIHDSAHAESNTPQVVKSVIHKMVEKVVGLLIV